MTSKKLLNPKGYLSWSQINLSLTNPDRYIRQYIRCEKDEIRTPSMTFGSRFAKAREDRNGGGNAVMQAAIDLVPQFVVRELNIRETMHTQHGDVDLLGRLDSFDPETLAFRDDKTGMTRWTQKKAEEHKQIRHYATLVYLKEKKPPKEAWIDWLETEIGDTDGVIRLTGKVQSFRVPIALGTILEYMALATRVAVEIDAAYREEMKRLT